MAQAGSEAGGASERGGDPREAVATLREALTTALKPVDKVRKGLDGLKGDDAFDRIDRLQKAADALRGGSLEAVGLDEQRRLALERIEDRLEELRREQRMTMLRELDRHAQAEGVEVQKLVDNPPTVRLAPMTAELDFDRGRARILYAREPVVDKALEAREILAGRREAMETIKEAALPSEDFFDAALRAYRTVLVARDLAEGERVDVVDLLAPLSLMQAGREQWRKKPVSKLGDYPRYLLAYQLSRLRRDGLLDRGGLRLELGTATGGSAKKKDNVLFVPAVGDEGQYYLSIRFVPSSGQAGGRG